MVFFKRKRKKGAEEMTNWFINTNISHVEERLIMDLDSYETGGEAMNDGLKQLEQINKIRNDNREADRKAKSDRWTVRLKIAGLVASIGTFLLMLKQEITGSFRSKGLTWFWDIFKGGKA